MNNSDVPQHQYSGEFFDENSFKTLYGGVFITWVSTNVIVDIWGNLDPKQLGLIIAIIVAFIGFLITERKSVKKLVLTPFNGFLIYLTIMGGTSFLPPPVEITPDDRNTEQVELESGSDSSVMDKRSSFISSWTVDRQLVDVTHQLQQQNRELESTTRELETEKQELINENTQLIQTARIYEARLDSTQRMIQQMELSPPQRDAILRQFQLERN